MKSCGKKTWIIPDCDLPPAGEGRMKGHESVVVVNDTNKPAHIKVKLYFPDQPCYEGIEWVVEPQRVRCIRLDNPEDMCGYVMKKESQYAIKMKSSAKIVVQYGRLDNRQTNLAYYTTLAY